MLFEMKPMLKSVVVCVCAMFCSVIALSAAAAPFA